MLAEDLQLAPPRFTEIFISYMHKDKAMFEQLSEQLSQLQHQGFISGWHQRKITMRTAGEEWKIDEAINNAAIILLLVSPAFLASEYSHSREIQRAIERHRERTACVIPILLSPVELKNTLLEGLAILPSNGSPISAWSRHAWSFINIAEGILDALKELNTPPNRLAYTAHAPTERPWNVPYQRNVDFSEYGHPIEYLRSIFRATIRDMQTQALSMGLPTPYLPALSHIQGRSGSGKTQHAIAYAYTYRTEYDAVFWINAISHQALALSFYEIAQALSLPEYESPIQEMVILAVLRWLQAHDQWLLIIDNINTLEQVYPFLPRRGRGHMLLLLHAEQSRTQGLNLGWLEPRQCQQLLLRKTSISSSTEPAPLEARRIVKSLIEAIGRLPLVLSLVSSYIDNTQCGIEEYRRRYRSHRLRPLHPGKESYSRAVHIALHTTLAQLQNDSPLALELLYLCAFLHPDTIPQEILLASCPEPPTNAHIAEPFGVNEAMALLQSYGLVHQLPQATRSFSIHRMLQAILKEDLSQGQRTLYVKRLVRTISLLLPTTYEEQPKLFARYVLHAQSCTTLIEQMEIVTPEAVELLYKLGVYLLYHAPAEARPSLQFACLIAEHIYGPYHQKVATILGLLADLYASNDEPELAESFYLRSIAIFDAMAGSHHYRLVAGLTNLAHLYKGQQKYEKAEELFAQALCLAEQFLGPDHHLLAFNITNLAQFYSEQQKPGQAKTFYERAITLLEKRYGPYHLEVVQALNNLAQHYIRSGQPEQALPLLQRILAISEQEGEDNPHLEAQSLYNLAQLFMHLGCLNEAEPLLQRSLFMYEQLFGANHPELRAVLTQLSLLYTGLGNYKQANETLQRTLATWQDELNSGSPISLLQEIEHLPKLQKFMPDTLAEGLLSAEDQ